MDASLLARCKPGAFLINIAPGGVVDDAALMEALRTERLAGAVLDVFNQEPLPPDSPLWHMDRLIITPPIGGTSQTYAHNLVGLVTHNLGCFTRGDVASLRNLMRARGTDAPPGRSSF